MSDASKDFPPKENWICDGNEEPIQEGYLVGDRRGLETLQRAIQKALDSEEGEASIEELRSSWSHVRIRSQHPQEEQKEFDATPGGKFGKVFGLSVLGIIAFLVILGCVQLVHLFK